MRDSVAFCYPLGLCGLCAQVAYLVCVCQVKPKRQGKEALGGKSLSTAY